MGNNSSKIGLPPISVKSGARRFVENYLIEYDVMPKWLIALLRRFVE